MTDSDTTAIPSGEYRDSALSVFGRIAIFSMLAVLMVVIGFGPNGEPFVLDLLMKAGAILLAGAAPLVAYRAIRDRARAPRIRLTQDGIYFRPQGPLSPFADEPEPELIPWDSIRSIEPLSGPVPVVVVDYDGCAPSGLERVLPRRQDVGQGRLIPLTGLRTSARRLQAELVLWSEDRLRLTVRESAGKSLPPEAPGEEAL